ncbi:hypothetical protein CRP01_19830 [Flavilitoribacter nigricans DSM 23189 = NBRC 102662]|uniref:Uncharacterized protein n=1 Tax=Flavilitoribacter nigricans (strain ATCC 23147 / DSM 23189 / NBRC 102662 / NCIMB 1420 / SS-2) TaxID=1122177 RepID=A0A2D0N8C4_FLAN2|nr:hypothetical protein CRP01_19830 [Flavilitoribacter nigricans DSM 23189 = NBRC 102662]
MNSFFRRPKITDKINIQGFSTAPANSEYLKLLNSQTIAFILTAAFIATGLISIGIAFFHLDSYPL